MARKKDEAAAAAAGEEAAEEQTEEKQSKKAPKPEGFVSPYDLHKTLNERLNPEPPIRPQTIYGFVRNETVNKLEDGTEIPFPVQKNTDGKYMVPEEEAVAWYMQRLELREAKKAAKEAEEAAASDE